MHAPGIVVLTGVELPPPHDGVATFGESGRHNPRALAVGCVRARRKAEAVATIRAVAHLGGNGRSIREVVASVWRVSDVHLDCARGWSVGMVLGWPAPAHCLALCERGGRVLSGIHVSRDCPSWARIWLLVSVADETTGGGRSPGSIVTATIAGKWNAGHDVSPVAGKSSARACGGRLWARTRGSARTIVVNTVEPRVRCCATDEKAQTGGGERHAERGSGEKRTN